MWDRLESLGVSEQTLQIVTSIDGYSRETLEGVLYAHTGYRNFDQTGHEAPCGETFDTAADARSHELTCGACAGAREARS